ncbi:Amastin surface glycofamily protein [Leishmania donovani]|uniref:Amastin surface glycofamily protein n=1 Tax=Leishmania donovani TaxID=5661 RepID=A0A504XN89_LEIDO|nr:Amastin surface glycofamily protein [Leishmania donovani]TPP50432.1 Amastin surface glycofamily protein [Leishmania donovani]
MACNISIAIYIILQFIAFFFVLVGTPLDMFRGTNKEVAFSHFCLTLWGAKWGCSNSSYFLKSDEVWTNCTGRRNRFRAAQALAVISIFLYGAAFVLGIFFLLCCPFFRWVCLVLNIVGIFSLGIVWAAVVLTHYADEDDHCPKMERFFKLGVGFAFFLVAWCLDIINIFLLLIRCEDQKFGERDDEAEHKVSEGPGLRLAHLLSVLMRHAPTPAPAASTADVAASALEEEAWPRPAWTDACRPPGSASGAASAAGARGMDEQRQGGPLAAWLDTPADDLSSPARM